MKIPKHNHLITAYGCGVDELGERGDPAQVLPASPSPPRSWGTWSSFPISHQQQAQRRQKIVPGTLALEGPQSGGKVRRAACTSSQGNTGERRPKKYFSDASHEGSWLLLIQILYSGYTSSLTM